MDDYVAPCRRWITHVAAVCYALPPVMALPFFQLQFYLFWGCLLVLTVCAVSLIYIGGGRYRLIARYFLLLALVTPFVVLAGVRLFSVQASPDPKWFVWSLFSITPIFIGAVSLTPPSVNLWLARTLGKPIYPESVLPQQIEPVEEMPALPNGDRRQE